MLPFLHIVVGILLSLLYCCFTVHPITELCRYMEAYRAGATGNNVLEKTRELKKSHRVPLVIDQPAKVNYDRSRGRRLLGNLVGNQDQAGERREMVFDQESFATKICQMGMDGP